MSTNQSAIVDSRLAAWIFNRGLPLSIIDDGELQDIITLANPTYSNQTKLSTRTLGTHFLPTQHSQVEAKVMDRLQKAEARCILMDGWTGIQRRHALNLLVATPTPYFLTNIYTGSNECNAQYQFKLIKEHALNLSLPMHAICSDFASVMTATWRLLREYQPGILTYGCACHALQLLGRDVLKEPSFAKATTDAITIVTYFRRHLRSNGLASLQDLAKAIGKPFKQFCLPAHTRWNSHLSCAESVLKNRMALYNQVTHPDWLTDITDTRDKIATIVHSQSFWLDLQSYVDASTPIRDCILAVESDDACLSDVYNCLLYLKIKFSQLPPAYVNHCTTKFQARCEFLLHPAHVCAYLLDHRYAATNTIDSTQEYLCLSSVVSYMWPAISADQIETSIADFLLEKNRCLRNAPSSVNWYGPDRLKNSPQAWWAALRDRWPILHDLSTILFNLPCSASAAERVWSSADHIISKKRNCLASSTSTKLISLFWNDRVLSRVLCKTRKPSLPPQRSAGVLPYNHRYMTASSSSAPVDDFDEDYYDSDPIDEDDDATADNNASTTIVEVSALSTDRTFPGNCKMYSQVRIELGLKLLMWYDLDPRGWYAGTVTDYDEVSKRYRVDFDDGETYDMNPLSARSYGTNKSWVIADN
jgi:hypothetical protein